MTIVVTSYGSNQLYHLAFSCEIVTHGWSVRRCTLVFMRTRKTCAGGQLTKSSDEVLDQPIPFKMIGRKKD